MVKADARNLRYDHIARQGVCAKKKVGGKKWERRLCILTPEHLAWFEVRVLLCFPLSLSPRPLRDG